MHMSEVTKDARRTYKKRRQRNKKDTDHLSTEIDVKILKIDCEGCEFDAFLSSLNVMYE